MFPGSFDPFTAGHLNILKRALTMFDEVVVAVGVNIDKRGFFPNEKRIEIIRQATEGLDGVSVIQYDNLTIDKCRELGIRHIVRGVRNMIDFETERSIADANRKRGYGWSRVHINNIEVTDSIIRYGVTNRNGATGYWNGTWFSATDFKLTKVK